MEYTTPPGSATTATNVPVPEPVKKHASLGVASFIIAVIHLVLMLLVFMVIYSAVSSNGMYSYMSSNNDEMLGWVLKGLSIFGIGVNTVGLGLGITGLFQLNRRKVFAILGTAIHGLFILLTIIWIIAAMSSVPNYGM